MKRYDKRFLFAGIGLAILIFAASLVLFPDWRKEVSALIALAALALTAAFGFLASFRQAVEKTGEEHEHDSPRNKIKGDFIAGSQNRVDIDEVNNSPVVVGNHNTVQANYTVQDNHLTADPAVLRHEYLTAMFESVGVLQLAGIDPKAASEGSANLNLGAVYTALRTLSSDATVHFSSAGGGNPEQADRGQVENKPLSAVEMLNRHPHLVLLGDPGSGKSTFVNFVALCLAGEALSHPRANLALLTAPLPKEDGSRREEKEPPSQPWEHGALLPVRVVLRDFAARGLPPVGQTATARHLWDFIAAELEAIDLKDFSAYLNKELRERGGLLLVDGLDEVPEAGQRRVQIKQAIEGFSQVYPLVRILVTSRTYAYQNQDWRLQGYVDTQLAPFNRKQIAIFVERWYAQIAGIRKWNVQDAQGKAVLLKNAIFASDRLLGLAERPLLLTLMASLHAWRGGTLPEKREQLYADTVDLLLDWWESPKTVRDRQGKVIVQHPSLAEWLKVDRDKMRELLNELAFHAHAAQPDLAGTADVVQAGLVDGLMRLANNPAINPARLVEFLRDRAGLLLPRGEGVFTFPHRTFQEYLAACYLTDHDFPEQIAELACKDFNRWREVALLAGAKAGRGTASAVWSLVDALCYEDVPEQMCRENTHFWGAHLAAQALVENFAEVEKASQRNRPKVEKVRRWLVHILQQGELPVRERVLAGDNLARLGDPREELLTIEEIQFCFIPKGPFRMGDEKERKTVDMPAFWLARYPVTNAQFEFFVASGGYAELRYWAEAQQSGCWVSGKFKGIYDNEPRTRPMRFRDPFGLPNHPVVGVSWFEAAAFTLWLDDLAHASGWLNDQWRLRLPYETEWEKAARGGLLVPARVGKEMCNRMHSISQFPVKEPVEAMCENPQEDRTYPWGNEFHSDWANTEESGIGATSAVGCFPGGASPYGLEDLAGNVWEWQQDWTDKNKDSKSLRGGSGNNDLSYARCAFRNWGAPGGGDVSVGFRVSLSPPS